MNDFGMIDTERNQAMVQQIDQQIDQQIVRALEQPPQVSVPEGFAARVAQGLPARSVRRGLFAVPPGSAGKTAALAAAGLLAAALFVLAPHAGTSLSSVAFDVELLVLAELAAVGYGLARLLGGRL